MQPINSARSRSNPLLRWAVMIGIGLVVYLMPRPEAISPQGWRLLAFFAATVAGLILQPMPMGALSILMIALLALTRTVTVPMAFSAFSNPTVWLIVSAFLFARAVSITGLGRRIAFLLVRQFGKNSLGLGYALAGADLIVSPVIPSDTARAGGIIFPIARSLAEVYDSFPGPSARRLGAYLMQCAYHVGCTTAALFLTSMAANPLAAEFAKKVAGVDITWGAWAMASCVPGAISLALLPWAIFRLDPPEVRATPAARELAATELTKLGRMSRGELSLIVVLLLVIAGWSAQRWLGLHPVVMAFAGIGLLVLTGALRWQDVLEEHRAWDALIWFGALVMMAEGLLTLGVIPHFTARMGGAFEGRGWLLVFVLLLLAYIYIHYAFASMTAHITALYTPFLVLAVSHSVPPLMAALALAFASNLNASLTHYGTGPAPIFFGSGYVPLTTWWRVGFCVVLLNIAVWFGIGMLWWRALGLW